MARLWFRRKRYGYGWTPVTTEGWLVILLYVIGMLLISVGASDRNASGTVVLTHVIVPYVVLTAVLLVICYKKGEKPRWQWGKEDKQ